MDKQQRMAFNARNIAEFRESGGTLRSFGDAPVLLLTTTGAKSGTKRTTPLMYLADEAANQDASSSSPQPPARGPTRPGSGT